MCQQSWYDVPHACRTCYGALRYPISLCGNSGTSCDLIPGQISHVRGFVESVRCLLCLVQAILRLYNVACSSSTLLEGHTLLFERLMPCTSLLWCSMVSFYVVVYHGHDYDQLYCVHWFGKYYSMLFCMYVPLCIEFCDALLVHTKMLKGFSVSK